MTESRPSGQSALMSKTFAGQKCSPKTHDRPFIIEWDGTDLSRFESITTNDVVFVKYDGCELEVIDTCRDDSVHGSLGSYRPVDWTSGSVEKIDIANEAELFAKLPLGHHLRKRRNALRGQSFLRVAGAFRVSLHPAAAHVLRPRIVAAREGEKCAHRGRSHREPK